MKLDASDNDQLMALAALRYCLGRQTYIVGACLDWLRVIWPQMTRNTQHVVLRDILEALADDRAGNQHIDVPGWQSAAQWMYASMDADAQASVARAVANLKTPNVALTGLRRTEDR